MREMRVSQEDLVCANCVVKMRDPDCSVKLVRCEGCQLLHYCSTVCQTEHWHANHESLCRIFARKQILETAHQEGFCHTCSWESTLHMKTIFLLFYWAKYGYHVDDDDIDKIKDEDYHWQCPYQFGECTGEYLGWVDEYLAKIEELLTMLRTIYGGKMNPIVRLYYDRLRYEFLDLRAWYWYFFSLIKEQNSDLVDVFIARIAFSNISKRNNQTGTSPFAVLDGYFQRGVGSHPPLWESFLDLVSSFYQRLRMAKYCIINLDNLTKKKKRSLKDIVQYCKLSQNSIEKEEEKQKPIVGSANNTITELPLDTQCAACGLQLSGPAQTQPQVATLPWLQSPGATLDVLRFPNHPVIQESVGEPWLVTCALSECVSAGMKKQKERYSAERKTLLEFLSRSEQCNGCLRYSLKTHRCSACLSVRYCSAECLARDWANHRQPCQILTQSQVSVLGRKERNKSTVTSEDLLFNMDPYLKPYPQ